MTGKKMKGPFLLPPPLPPLQMPKSLDGRQPVTAARETHMFVSQGKVEESNFSEEDFAGAYLPNGFLLK